MTGKHVDLQVGVSEESVQELTAWCDEMQEAMGNLKEIIRRVPVTKAKCDATAEHRRD